MARVLLIDDEPELRLTLRQMLEAGGHDVTEGRQGLALLEDLATQTYDLVVTDIHMPGLDGWDVAAWVAERKPNVPVIAIGGDADAESEELRRLFAVIILKPFRRDALLQAVATATSRAG